MAGEWIAYDLALPAKPEVQELVDLTGDPVEVVVYRLLQLWGWASMHCADGTAKMTLPRLCRVCGASVEFWQAVESVGWLEIDETVATVAVPGWDRRFSQAAKERAQARDRAKDQRARVAHGGVRHERTGACAPGAPEEIRGEYPPPPQRDAGWEELRKAWNSGPGRKWTPPEPPDGTLERLSAPGWLPAAHEAIARLRACRFFEKPVTLIQFVKPGFVEKVLGGQYDDQKPTTGRRQSFAEDRPQPRVDPAFESARRATEEREAAKREAEHRRLDEQAAKRGRMRA
jgi:hypothetical protein